MTATGTDCFGTTFTVRIPARVSDTGKGVLAALSSGDSERIAIALSEVLQESDRKAGRPVRPTLMSDWVEVEKIPAAGTYEITVVDRDVMADVIPYVDPIGRVRFDQPMYAGRRLNGSKYHLHLNQHGQLIGSTTNGKSSLMQCAIAYATLCAEQNRDVVVWVGGTQKLYDLVADWVEPYLSSGLRCPIDWIANGAQDTLEMMAAAMRVGRLRQGTRTHERGHWPAILLVLDEVSFLLEKHGDAWVKFDGETMFPDTMLVDIVRGVTSSKVFAMLATQSDIHACFGDKGNVLQAQMAYSAMFKINDDSAHGRQLGKAGYQLKMPRFKGEYWAKDEATDLPVRVKAPYPQTTDPDKPRLHNGLTVADIAWSRRGMHTGTPHELDSSSAAAAGDAYRTRHTVVDDTFIAYLTGGSVVTINRPAEQAPQPRPVDPVYVELAEAEEELAGWLSALRDAGEQIPDDSAAFLADYESKHGGIAAEPVDDPQVASVSSLVGRHPRIDRIAEILRTHAPCTRAQVIDRLEEQGDRITNPQWVTNDLNRLAQRQRATRDGEGWRAL